MTARARRLAWIVSALAVAAGAACTPKPDASAPPPTTGGPVAEARSLIERGQADAALALLQQAPEDPESLYLQGRAWAKKAETAPLPTPPPVAGELPKGVAAPPAPLFKHEELQALALYEKAVAARSDLGAANVAIAELLAPHAIRRYDRQRETAAARGRRRGKGEPPPAPEGDAQGVDYSVERIVRAYDLASQSPATGRAAADGLIAFGARVGRLDAAESGFRILLQTQKEQPEPFVRYGDFLAEQKKDGDAAIEQYRQALIWKPDDEATRLKIADIYLARAIGFFDKQQFSVADSEFKQAAKWVARGSAQEAQLKSYQSRLLEIRMPAVRPR
jgi:tetratricopeptide (TPR) repeat protein